MIRFVNANAKLLKTCLPLTLAVFSLACGRLDTFTIERTAQTTVPGASILEQLAGDIGFEDLATFDVTDDETLANQGVTKNQIDSVTISTLSLRVVSPMSGDFTFLDRLEFFVSSPGLQEKRIAAGGPFAMGDNEVFMTLDMVELAPYATADSMKISTQVEGRRPDEETQIEARIELLVDVSVSGLLSGE